MVQGISFIEEFVKDTNLKYNPILSQSWICYNLYFEYHSRNTSVTIAV